MRLILKLKSNKTVSQNRNNNSKYYSGMHGWIYNKLKNTDFSELHSENGFKPFCFSNLFLIKEKLIKENQIYSIIISSPNEMLMVSILSQMNIGDLINIGEYSFELISYKPLGKINFSDGTIIESETITNVSLHENSKTRSITLTSDSKTFKDNLGKNLIGKYNQFSKENINEDFDLWENIEIREMPKTKKAVKINFIKNSDNWFNVIGARYQFKLEKTNETQKKIFELCYDLGFGERNTFGFGFMNIKEKIVGNAVDGK